MEDHYDLLGISKDATSDQIKTAYRKLAKQYHPDNNMNRAPEERTRLEETLKRINGSYAILNDPIKRSEYDSRGKDGFSKECAEEDVCSTAKSKTDEDIFGGFDDKIIVQDLFSNLNTYISTKGESKENTRIRTKAAISVLVDGGILLFMYWYRHKDEFKTQGNT